MSLRPRALHAVVRARTRMRDLAAAGEARAQTAEQSACDAASRAVLDLDAALDDAGAQLSRGSSVTEIARIIGDLGTERAAVIAAEAARTKAAAELELAASELRMRERQRRTVERALEDLYSTRDRRDAKDEQRLTDDLGGRRRTA